MKRLPGSIYGSTPPSFALSTPPDRLFIARGLIDLSVGVGFSAPEEITAVVIIDGEQFAAEAAVSNLPRPNLLLRFHYQNRNAYALVAEDTEGSWTVSTLMVFTAPYGDDPTDAEVRTSWAKALEFAGDVWSHNRFTPLIVA